MCPYTVAIYLSYNDLDIDRPMFDSTGVHIHSYSHWGEGRCRILLYLPSCLFIVFHYVPCSFQRASHTT